MKQSEMREIWGLCVRRIIENGMVVLSEQSYKNMKILCDAVLDCGVIGNYVVCIYWVMFVALRMYKVD